MLKRVVPRCDRKYTFQDSNGSFTIRPVFVNNQHQIVFINVNTKNNVEYSLAEFSELYENNLLREVVICPGFFNNKEINESKTIYAVARGRLDFFITNKKYLYYNAIFDFDGACFGVFDNIGDAIDFLRETDTRLPESARLIESSLTDTEMKIIKHYRRLSKYEKKEIRTRLFVENNKT